MKTESVRVFTRFRFGKNRLDSMLRLTDYVSTSMKDFNKHLKQFYIFH